MDAAGALEVWVWVVVAVVFITFATLEALCRLMKKEPLWRTLRRWAMNIFDTLSGGL